jgi:hypothetical protein
MTVIQNAQHPKTAAILKVRPDIACIQSGHVDFVRRSREFIKFPCLSGSKWAHTLSIKNKYLPIKDSVN